MLFGNLFVFSSDLVFHGVQVEVVGTTNLGDWFHPISTITCPSESGDGDESKVVCLVFFSFGKYFSWRYLSSSYKQNLGDLKAPIIRFF